MMRVFAATVYKELLLIFRDRAGIAVLFMMPVILVVAFTLVQENVLKTDIDVLLINKAGKDMEHFITRFLSRVPNVNLVTSKEKDRLTEDQAKQAVIEGDYQFCVIIPEKMGVLMKDVMDQKIRSSVNDSSVQASDNLAALPEIVLYYDPVVQGSYRAAVFNALQRVISEMENRVSVRIFSQVLVEKLSQSIMNEAGIDVRSALDSTVSGIDFDQAFSPTIGIRQQFASRIETPRMPTTVQQNVPAWSIFGIFFIVIPLSGTLIQERKNRTMARLLTLPVPHAVIIGGKVAAYVSICLCQFLFILFIGTYLLPLLGTPRLEIGSDPAAVAVIAMSICLAASGYGILVGSLARTFEQASIFGAVSVVIAALIGGIMVPVYAMPGALQKMSVLSPLSWGLNAFMTIFVKNGRLNMVLGEVGLLLAFSLISLLISWYVFVRRAGTGG